MPIYEYRCPNGHTFEVFQRMSDPPIGSCETCGAAPVEKVLFPVAVHFKGSGFYSTDYGKGSRKGGRDGDSGDSGGSDKGGEKAATDKKESAKDSSSGSTSSSGDAKKASDS